MPSIEKFSPTPSVAIIIAGVIIAGSILYANQTPAATVAVDDALPPSTSVPQLSSSDHVLGDPQAPIVLIEYSDFECYYCAQAYPTLKRLVEESDGQVAWAMRHLPLESIHPNARPAAIASECLAEERGSDAFWNFADVVFEGGVQLSASSLRQTALSLGATPAFYDQCVASGRHEDLISRHTAEAFSAGGQGTPFTVVWSANYQAPVSGALPYDQFKSVISSVESRL